MRMLYTCNLFVFYFGAWTFQKKAISIEDKGYLGSRYDQVCMSFVYANSNDSDVKHPLKVNQSPDFQNFPLILLQDSWICLRWFLLSTMKNHHWTTIWEICLYFSNHPKQI